MPAAHHSFQTLVRVKMLRDITADGALLLCDRATVEYHTDMPDEHLPPIHVDVASNDIDFIIRSISIHYNYGNVLCVYKIGY